MISPETQAQLNALHILPTKPIVICDVDEVVVHFTRDLEDYLAQRDMWLQPTSLALSGNIRRRSDHGSVAEADVMMLIDDFFATRTRFMKPIAGAVEALEELSKHASIVMLTNLPHFAGDDRRANLAELGVGYPVVTNSGPKGPALHHIAALSNATTIFVDDSPSFIQSAYDHAPQIHLIHFLHDERFAAHMPHFDFVSKRTGAWAEALLHILKLLNA